METFKRPALDGDLNEGKVLVFLPSGSKPPVWRQPKFRKGAWYVRHSYGWRALVAVVRNGRTAHFEVA